MLKHFVTLLFCLFSILFSSQLFAGVFDVAPTDDSKRYLGIIFGGNVGTVYLGPNPNPLLSLMFERFNFIIVTVGVLVLGWIAFVSALNTAREGQALGTKMSLWTPVRALFGMLMMIPTPGTGYSVLQIAVIWIVLNGIGAANSIWNVVLDQLDKGAPAVGALNLGLQASDIAPQKPPPIDAPSLIQAAVNAKVCMHVLNSLPQNSAWSQYVRSSGLDSVSVHLIYDNFFDPSLPPVSNPNPTSISSTGRAVVGFQNPSGGYFPVCGFFNVGSTLTRMAPSVPGLKIPARNSFNAASVITRRDAKLAALSAMLDAVDPLAKEIASGVIKNVAAGKYEFPVLSPPQYNIPLGYAMAGANAYINGVSKMSGGVRVASGTGAGSAVTSTWQQDADPISANAEIINQLRQIGWINAGSYYFALAGGSGAGLDDDAKQLPAYYKIPTPIVPVPPITGTSLPVAGDPCQPGVKAADPWEKNGLTLTNGVVKEICSLYYALTSAYAYVASDTTNRQPQSIPIFGSNPGSYKSDYLDDAINTIIGPLKNYIVDGFLGMTNTTGEPLSSISSFGTGLMKIAEAITLGYIATSVLLTFGLSWDYCLASLGPGLHTLFLQFIFMVTGLFILLWSTGAMLGLYVPMIPYIIFITTAFGWMIAVAEALVGAPIIALGIVQPGGEELGKSVHSLGILANIFLRPTLMIFGFVIGASLLRAALSFLNFGFANTVQIATNGLVSPFGFPAVLSLYMGMVLVIVNKSFSLIYLLPDQIFRWMGMRPEETVVKGMEQEAKGKFEGGVQGAEGVQKGIVDSGQKALAENQKKRASKK